MQMEIAGESQRIALFGLFGIGNLGNDATLWVTLHHLRTRLPQVRIVCVCNEIPAVVSSYGVTVLALNQLPIRGRWRIANRALRNVYAALATFVTGPLRVRRMAGQLNDVDQFLIVGTGILDDFGLLPWDMPTWLLGWCQAARKIGASVQLIAVGAGPIENRVNRFIMKRAIKLATKRSFRDTGSRDYVERLDLDTKNDAVVPDLVFGLPAEIIHGYRTPSTSPGVIGVGLMGYYGWEADEIKGRMVYRGYISKMGLFVKNLLERGYTVRLLIGEMPTDEPAVSDVLDVIFSGNGGVQNPKLFAEPIDSFERLLGEIERTDMVVASRFHNVVCALALGRPAMSIGYAEKFELLMEEFGLGEYCQNIEQLDVQELMQQFENLIRKYSCLKELVQEKSKQYRVSLEAFFDTVFAR